MTAASDFEQVIARAVADRIIPGVALLAENTSGSFHYEKIVGLSSLEPGKEKTLERDSVFMFMSLSKLITAITVLQAVEKGLVDLDADVAPILPELAALPVLKGFSSDDDDAVPELVPRESPITLRQLLTHTSGASYDFLNTDLMRYNKWLAAQPPSAGLEPPPKATATPSSVEARFRYPLIFQPGQGWSYGAGVDWAGRLVERIHAKAQGKTALEPETNPSIPAISLEDLVVRDILTPLGLAPGSMTFHPERYPSTLARLWPSLPVRASGSSGPDAGPVVHGPSLYRPAPAALGGQGLYGEVPAFFEVQLSLLRDDGRLLKPASSQLLYEPQLATDAARKSLLYNTENPGWITGDVPNTGEYDWGLGGLLVTGSSHPTRKQGAVFWSGAINLTWIIDREANICAVFASNYQPPGDVQGKELMRKFEAFVFPQAQAAKL